MRTLLFILTIVVIALAVMYNLRSPSMKEEEEACARKCQAEGFRSYRFTPPGFGDPRANAAPPLCQCER